MLAMLLLDRVPDALGFTVGRVRAWQGRCRGRRVAGRRAVASAIAGRELPGHTAASLH